MKWVPGDSGNTPDKREVPTMQIIRPAAALPTVVRHPATPPLIIVKVAQLVERLWSKIDVRGPDECWPWLRAVGHEGYGAFWYEKKVVTAHSVVYRLEVGPIPDGFTVDHLCRNRLCCNPVHLEAVTRGENVLRGGSITAVNARKTHCLRGHPFDEANTYVVKATGGRRCRTCVNELQRKRYRARREEGPSCG